jgi:hypothetical protein
MAGLGSEGGCLNGEEVSVRVAASWWLLGWPARILRSQQSKPLK